MITAAQIGIVLVRASCKGVFFLVKVFKTGKAYYSVGEHGECGFSNVEKADRAVDSYGPMKSERLQAELSIHNAVLAMLMRKLCSSSSKSSSSTATSRNRLFSCNLFIASLAMKDLCLE